MLPAQVRMRATDDFRAAVARGRRCGRSRLVVHLLAPRQVARPSVLPVRKVCSLTDIDVKVGFIVSRRVGAAAARNRVQRRLRHAARSVVEELPAGSRLVVRALPAAAGASYADLASDLVLAVRRCLSAASSRAECSGAAP
jgi:ribonuclease P protein component